MTANKLALFKRGRVAALTTWDGVIDGGVYDGGGGDGIQATEKMVDGIKKAKLCKQSAPNKPK